MKFNDNTKVKALATKKYVIEMFHDPGECHMSDPIFVHHKRWHSVSFAELQKESPNFQREDLT